MKGMRKSQRVRGFLLDMLDRASQALVPEADRPPMPPRLRQEVQLWLATHPQATITELAEFAVAHAEEAHQAGFQRGMRWQALQADGAHQQALDAEHRLHCFSLAGSRPFPPDAFGLEEVTQDSLAQAADYEGRYWGTHRVVILPQK